MELAKIRKYRKLHKPALSLLTKNPVMVMGLGLPFLIATSISLRAAAAMSLELMLIHMGTMFAALFTCRLLSGWAAPLVNVTVSTVIMVFTRLMLVNLFHNLADSLGMYIYLMAVNGMTVYQSGAVTKKDRPLPVLASSFVSVIGFSVAMFLTALLREYFGNGTLWGFPVPVPVKLPGIRAPFFGFITVGLMLAGARSMNKLLAAISLHERARKDARFSVVD